MARYPAAIWNPLPENATQPAITPIQVIVHTAVDHPGPSNLKNFFGRSDVSVESHFWLPNDGKIEQFMDTNVRADANLAANDTAISIETEDDGDPEGNPWTPEQIDALIDCFAWIRETHGIPLVQMATPESAGVGWHSMWGFDDPINLTGVKPNPWTPSLGKTCPGRTRIRQLLEEVLPVFDTSAKDARIAELEASVAKHKATSQRLRAQSQRLREDTQRLRADLVAERARTVELQPPPVPGVDLPAFEAMERRALLAEAQIRAVRAALATTI